MPTLVSTGEITIVDVNDGSSAYLTNNSAVLPADSAGTVSSYVGAETFFKVVEANVDTTNNWSFYVSATGGGVAYRDSDDVADRTGTGTAGYLGGTNSIRNSAMVGAVAGTPGTAPTNWFRDPGATGLSSTIVGTGTDGGITYIDIRIFGTAASASYYSVSSEGSAQVVAANGGTWTNSAYLKLAGGSTSGLNLLPAVGMNENTSAGVYVAGGNSGGITPTSEWRRVTFTRTLSGGATVARVFPYVIFTVNNGAAIDITLRIGLPQLELGSTATEVTPTTGTAASGTRGYLKITSLTQDLSYLDITATKIGGQSITQRYSVARATKGATGTRGTITTSAATAGVVWSDAEANTAISTAGGGSPLAGDVVTLYNSASSFSQTRVRTSGGAWAALAAFFGGDVLVDGTLGAAKLAANSVTANKVAAGAITASKIAVADLTNLIKNPSFQSGSSDGWALTGTSSVVAKGAVGVPSGAPSEFVVKNPLLVSTNNDCQATGAFDVRPGEVYYFEWYAASDASANGYNRIFLAITDQTGVGFTWPGIASTPSNSTTWTRYFGQITIPDTFVYSSTTYVPARATISFGSVGGASAAGNWYVTKLHARKAATAELIVDGAVTAAKITANTITAGQIAANTITASRLLIADLSNAAPDADMSDSNSWSTPTAWETPPSASWRGSRVARLDGAVSVYTVLSGKVFPVEAGASLHFSYQGQVLAGAGSFGGQIQLSAATDMSTPSYIGGGNSTSTTLVTSAGNFTVPAGMKYARVQLLKNNDAATSVRVGGVIVRRAANAELIVDGAISAAKIAAGAITTDKLLVTGRGKALNDDPTFQDASAWTLGGGAGSYALVTESTSPVGTKVLRATNDVQFRARSFPITAGTRYKVTMWAQQTSGTGVMYLRLYCYNAASTLINYVATTVSPGSGTLEGIDVPATWTKYIGYVDAGAATVTGQLIVHVNWGGGGGVTDIADCRVEEYIGADLIVDGAITAGKLAANSIAVGTAAIQNGAIVNAMIGNATITDAKIADLSATKITAGTLDAARIAAGSITADKIKVSSRGGLTLLSDDPLFQDSTLWTVLQGNINFSTGTTASGAKGTTYIVSNDGTDRIIQSARFYEIDPNETYRLTALLYRDPTSNRNMYLFVEFYDYNLAYVTGATTGWGGSKSGYVYGAVPPTANVFQRLGGNFGPNTGRTIPSTVRYCKIGAWFNYSGNGTTTATQAFQDLRLDQVVNGGQLIVDGTITATQIDSRGLSIRDASNNIILAAGSPLAASNITPAAGWLNSNVSISSAGVLSGAGGGTVTLPGIGLSTFRVVSSGYLVATAPTGVGFYNADTGSSLVGVASMYRVVKINRSTGAVTDVGGYNTLAGAPNPANMAAALNAIGSDHIVIVFSYDEPQGNRLTGGLDAAMYRCGASKAIFGSTSAFKYRSSYILIGIPGCGEGGGTEAYAGATDNDANAWCDLTFSVRNGNVIVGPSKTPTDLVTSANPITSTNVSTYIASAAITNAYIGGAIQSTNYVAGSAGWSIDKAGTAEFNTGTFRGALAAASGTFAGSLSAATGTFAGSLSAAGGTFAGTLTAAAVNAVNTINIAGQAVTIPVSVYTASSSPGNTANTEYTVATLSITSSGAPIVIWGAIRKYTSGTYNGTSGSITGTARLKRTTSGVTTTLQTFTVSAGGSLINIATDQFVFTPQTETPGSGSHTYFITIAQDLTVATQSATSIGLVVLEVKK